jgi:hypothetical protein
MDERIDVKSEGHLDIVEPSTSQQTTAGVGDMDAAAKQEDQARLYRQPSQSVSGAEDMAMYRRNNKRLLSDDAESAERIRLENRQRKKKWREANEDRNKDNDLRCRVTKRANKLFGPEASERKAVWIEGEFKRRQSKRQEKERKRAHDGPEMPSILSAINMAQFQQTLVSSFKSYLSPAATSSDTPQESTTMQGSSPKSTSSSSNSSSSSSGSDSSGQENAGNKDAPEQDSDQQAVQAMVKTLVSITSDPETMELLFKGLGLIPQDTRGERELTDDTFAAAVDVKTV